MRRFKRQEPPSLSSLSVFNLTTGLAHSRSDDLIMFCVRTAVIGPAWFIVPRWLLGWLLKACGPRIVLLVGGQCPACGVTGCLWCTGGACACYTSTLSPIASDAAAKAKALISALLRAQVHEPGLASACVWSKGAVLMCRVA